MLSVNVQSIVSHQIDSAGLGVPDISNIVYVTFFSNPFHELMSIQRLQSHIGSDEIGRISYPKRLDNEHKFMVAGAQRPKREREREREKRGWEIALELCCHSTHHDILF
jgi:hypothetical protein